MGITATSKACLYRTLHLHRPLRGTAVASTDTQKSSSAGETATRSSSNELKEELESVYELIERNRRGCVYLGSSRVHVGHRHYQLSRELAKATAELLQCTTWSGIGEGLMDAVTLGAIEAGYNASGLNILIGEYKDDESCNTSSERTVRVHPYLLKDKYLTCKFFSARKHGLVDAGMRVSKECKTAFFALPGGIGTLDELFEILTLYQLRRVGTNETVPFFLMNYDGFYDKLLHFMNETLVEYGLVNEGELNEHLIVVRTNEEAIEYLKKFYSL
jgi:uncharacterized protein (TIGR00730 family)